MRMRRKKHREERMDVCSDIMIENFADYKNDLKSVFDDDKPLHIEIGCGKGKFMLETAKSNPDVNFIAIEKNLDVLVLAMEKVKREGLTNVRFVAGDAGVLSEFESKTKCDVIYINFCDPWKKNRQAKRRLTHENFLNVYKKIITSSGMIRFKTDNKMLFEFSLNSFSDYGLRLKNITLDLHNSIYNEGNVMTEYETLFSEKGQPIYSCQAIYELN